MQESLNESVENPFEKVHEIEELTPTTSNNVILSTSSSDSLLKYAIGKENLLPLENEGNISDETTTSTSLPSTTTTTTTMSTSTSSTKMQETSELPVIERCNITFVSSNDRCTISCADLDDDDLLTEINRILGTVSNLIIYLLKTKWFLDLPVFHTVLLSNLIFYNLRSYLIEIMFLMVYT